MKPLMNLKKTLLSIVSCFFIGNIYPMDNVDTNHMINIFSTPQLRDEFAGFLDSVVMQIPSQEFYAIVDRITRYYKPETDAALYKRLLSALNKIKPTLAPYYQLKTLQRQKKILTAQAQQLLGKDKKINGCVEIGTPGTYLTSMKSFLDISGKMYYLNDATKITDRAQAFSFNPLKKFLAYDHFISLNNYAKISEEDIPSQSVDLIVCFIGLHHIPKENLEDFVGSLARILRPGGVFLLRDHDANTPELLSIAHAAHSVFNAVIPSLSIEDELDEYRNFHELQFWINILERHGFQVGSERMLQEGDPTVNTMIRCTKLPMSDQERTLQISYNLKNEKEYERDGMQSILSGPEWLNVNASEEYAKFINHTPFYEFPYIENVKAGWRVFAKSWQTAAKKNGHLKVLTSPYTLMNLFVLTTMSVEYGIKSAMSWPIRMMYSGAESLTIKLLVRDPNNEVLALDNQIKVLQTYPDSACKLIEMPRYKEFLRIMQQLVGTNIVVVEIAGQEEIQFKIRCKKDELDKLNTLPDGCSKEYDWSLPTQPKHMYCALMVNVSIMKEVIDYLIKQGIEIVYIHDF